MIMIIMDLKVKERLEALAAILNIAMLRLVGNICSPKVMSK